MKRSIHYSLKFFMLSLLVLGMTLSPALAGAADWISDQDAYAAPWVKTIEQELNKKDYRWVFANDPRTPQASIIKFLNEAAKAYQAGNKMMGQQLVRRAITVLEEGVDKGYYSMPDVEPVLSAIRQHTPEKV